MIEIIENKIIEKLKENFFEFEIQSFPVDFENYYITGAKGCILVRYENSKMSAQNSMTAVNSDETYNFSVFTGIRYLQKHSDGYPHLKKLKKVLNGMTIQNKRVAVIEQNFEDEIRGDLYYGFKVSIEFPLIDEYEDLSIASFSATALSEQIEGRDGRQSVRRACDKQDHSTTL